MAAETGAAGDAGVGLPRRPARADARRNYDKLLEVAGDAFQERGVDASLEEIARQAGVGIGTLYRHFPTRQDLVAAVYVNDVESMCARGRELQATLPPEEALTQWLATFVGYARRKRGITAALKSAIGAESDLFAYCHRQIKEVGSSLMQAAAEAGAVRNDMDVWDVLRAVSGVCMASQDLTDSAQTDRMLRLILDGLRYQPVTSEVAD